MIFTFYSFKGGVGRSMALANIAELFYQAGLKVLIVDWDLEAPGLERFFFEDVQEILDKPGVIDLLSDYKKKMAQKISTPIVEGLPFDNPNDYIIDVYPFSKSSGKIFLLTAGRRSKDHYANYADLVINFDWSDFYANWDGELYFEWLREQFESLADIVLIDSRTGITEMGGVCTYQFADVVVMFCAPNNQNLEGLYEMAENLKREEILKLRNNRFIELLIIPSRVEDRSEEKLLDDFRHRFINKFEKFCPKIFKGAKGFFWSLMIPHVPFYAFNEAIAVREKENSSNGTSLAISNTKDIVKAYGSIANAMARFISFPEIFEMPKEDRKISHLQNLRDLTVQIRRANNNSLVGNGIIVSNEGIILTSATVMDKVFAEEAEFIEKREVVIYFPQIPKGNKSWHANIYTGMSHSNDPLVLLKLKDKPPMLDQMKIASIGTAETSQGNRFRTYGFHEMYKYGIYTDGIIQNEIAQTNVLSLRANSQRLQFNKLDSYFAGAAVLDVDRNLLVGIISGGCFSPNDSGHEEMACLAVDTNILNFEPFNLPIFLEMGKTYTQRGEHKKAIEAYLEAININQMKLDALMGLGISYSELGKCTEAISAYERAIEIDSSIIDSWIGLGNNYINIDKYDKAVEAYQKAIEIDPNRGILWKVLADTFSANKRHEEAIEAYEKAIELDPKLISAWKELVRTYTLTKKFNKLIEAYKKFIKTNPACWADLLRFSKDDDVGARRAVVTALGTSFDLIPDKEVAWSTLQSFTSDRDGLVRCAVAEAIGFALNHLPNKDKAWWSLQILAQDEDISVRRGVATALRSAFLLLPEKDQLWLELHKLILDESDFVRLGATETLRSIYAYIPDKSMAWQDLHNLTIDLNINLRCQAAEALGESFPHVPDKEQAWEDLHRLTQDRDSIVRWGAASSLGSAFPHVPDKEQAWEDLHRLTQDKDSSVRRGAAGSLGLAFPHVPDKDQAWMDLHRLAQDLDSSVRWGAARSLGSALPHVPDKRQAWEDLYRLTQDENSSVGECAVDALGLAFPHVPDKEQAWEDLHRLTQDRDSIVRWGAASSLGSVFQFIPDKEQAWEDLHRLTQDRDSDVRWGAASSLGSAFGLILDKDQAWKDLIRLTQDENSSVRECAAGALGSVFELVPKKQRALEDLHRLTQDKDSSVRMYAYHSLGKAAVYYATESENINDLREYLKIAVEYFEKSAHESEFGPGRFCYPFYRSYFAITMESASDEEVQRYLKEAKSAVGTSESKAELLEAVENLAKALHESKNLMRKSFEEIADELNAYRWFCEKAAEHMLAAEEGAPGAVKLMRKANPLLEDRIQVTIAEISKSARKICEITRGSGSEYEAPGTELQKAAKGLYDGDLASIQKNSSRIVRQLKKFCSLLPAEDKQEVCSLVEEIEHEPEFPEKLRKIETALLYLAPVLDGLVSSDNLSVVDVVILTVLPEEYSGVLTKLQSVSKPREIGSVPNIYAWRFAEVLCPKFNGTYKVAVGMIGRAGTTEIALAAREAIQLWRPRYIFLSGIAGGLPDPREKDARPKLGDVVIADVIYGYEYGKIEKAFKPRTNWAYRTDQALLTGASTYALSDGWKKGIKAESPKECHSKVIIGDVASGEKVMDDPTNDFFSQVRSTWPKIKAVEMEGTGAASAIEQAQSLGIPVSFLIIRGISDMPRPEKSSKSGKNERDSWKLYASDTAAAFVVGWITDGLPLPPRQ